MRVAYAVQRCLWEIRRTISLKELAVRCAEFRILDSDDRQAVIDAMESNGMLVVKRNRSGRRCGITV